MVAMVAYQSHPYNGGHRLQSFILKIRSKNWKSISEDKYVLAISCLIGQTIRPGFSLLYGLMIGLIAASFPAILLSQYQGSLLHFKL